MGLAREKSYEKKRTKPKCREFVFGLKEVELNPASSSSRDIWIQDMRAFRLLEDNPFKDRVAELLSFMEIEFEREFPIVIRGRIFFVSFFIPEGRGIINLGRDFEGKRLKFERAGFRYVNLSISEGLSDSDLVLKMSYSFPESFPAYLYIETELDYRY